MKQELIKKFTNLLTCHAKRKEELYDGSNREFEVDQTLRFAIEELGEIAGAITRERYLLAEEECIDLAHCAMLIWLSLKNRKD